jgi:hypothetical protein
MRTVDDLTPDQVKANAKEWFRRQCEISQMALGPLWPLHQAWIEAYLLQEVKERLAARGWKVPA